MSPPLVQTKTFHFATFAQIHVSKVVAGPEMSGIFLTFESKLYEMASPESEANMSYHFSVFFFTISPSL